MRAEPLEPADEDAEPGGVEEVDVGEVDDQRAGAGRCHLHDRLAQLWRGRHVDLAVGRDDGDAVLVGGRKREVHRGVVTVAGTTP